MTRAEQIQILQYRYRKLVYAHKWKSANMVFARLRELMLKQLKWENRKCNP